MSNLKSFKKIYDNLSNDYLRSAVLSAAGMFGIRKNLVRLDTNCCCNIRCIMCDAKPPVQSSPYMKLEEFQEIMDIFAPTTRILYLSCSYEPLITPNFSEFLYYAKQKGIPHVSLCTNGLLMNNHIIDSLVENEIDEVILSFNGFCKDDYNRIMKGSDYDKVCTNLAKLTMRKKQLHSDKPRLRMNTVLLKSNLDHFENMYKIISDYNIETIQFRELIFVEGQNDPHEVEKELLKNQALQEYQNTVNKIKNMAERLQAVGKEIIIPSYFLKEPVLAACMEAGSEMHPVLETKDFEQMHKEKQVIQKRMNIQKKHCSIPFFSYWIDYIGNVRICNNDKNGRIGNVLKEPGKLLKQKQRQFQKQALSGHCQYQNCTINADTSTII